MEEPKCLKRQCIYYVDAIRSDYDESNEKPQCFAFPDGIPDEIAHGDNPHTHRMKGQFGNFIYTQKTENGDEIIEFLTKVDLFKIAQDYADTHTILCDNAVSECEKTHPDLELNDVKRAFLRRELEYLMAIKHGGAH